MLNDMIVVQTATSAFNNMALGAPAFLYWAILALPIFIITYLCATPITVRIGWHHNNIGHRAPLLTVVCALAWLVMFGGNYNVLRDGVSLLPWLIASILFVGTIFITSHIRTIAHIPARRRAVIIILGTVALAVTGAPTWWGPLLQIGAVALGYIVGRHAKSPMRITAGTVLIISAITTAIMMQPEFFRFGKLGELTFMHLACILSTGVFATATLATQNITPRNRIRAGIYIKLKWMLRFVALLCAALMFVTESVPLFLGTLAVLFIMFAISIWHRDNMAPDLSSRMLIITICLFGVTTAMPVVTSIGILYWAMLPARNIWSDGRFLL